jgi:hypothetical protein
MPDLIGLLGLEIIGAAIIGVLEIETLIIEVDRGWTAVRCWPYLAYLVPSIHRHKNSTEFGYVSGLYAEAEARVHAGLQPKRMLTTYILDERPRLIKQAGTLSQVLPHGDQPLQKPFLDIVRDITAKWHAKQPPEGFFCPLWKD